MAADLHQPLDVREDGDVLRRTWSVATLPMLLVGAAAVAYGAAVRDASAEAAGACTALLGLVFLAIAAFKHRQGPAERLALEPAGLRASSLGGNVAVAWASIREADLVGYTTMGQSFTYLGLRLEDRASARVDGFSRLMQGLSRLFVGGGWDVLIVVDALGRSPQELLDEVRARIAA